MDTSWTTNRKNFRCVFNKYVNEANKDAVIRSVISQFEGYYADPEVTLTDEGFILSVNTGENLSPSSVRDKILWNQFVERVTAQDAIRKIQIIRLPQSSKENEGTVGAFGPHGSDSGVDEVDGNPHMEYKIDMGDRPDGPILAALRYADPDGQMLPEIYGPGAEDGEPVDEDVISNATDMTKPSKAKLFMGFKVVAFESDIGGSFTMTKPNGMQDLNPPAGAGRDQVAKPGTGIGGGADLSGASWFVYDPLNSQSTAPGDKRDRYDPLSAPFSDIQPAAKSILGSLNFAEDEEEGDEQGIKGPYGATLNVLGAGEDPMGGAAYGSIFGINETYDYEGDLDVNDF
jgi:hypothetical protein